MAGRRVTAQRRPCVGAVLAGGSASRMGGQPKGLASIADRRMIDRCLDALAVAADRPVLVANDPGATAWAPGVDVIADRRQGCGPLAGIEAALAATGGDAIVVAWDMPFVPGDLLRAVRDAGEVHDALWAAPTSASPWGYEPLCAWYSARALPHVSAMLDSGERTPGRLADRAPVRAVDVSSWGDPSHTFFSVNTPADLERAATMAAERR